MNINTNNSKVKLNIIFVLGILIPTLLVYKNFFLPGPLAWGDAPNFFSEELKQLVSEPLSWTNRGISLGGINVALWLSPLLFLYGSLYKFLSIGNDLAIRLLFYFPSVLLAGFSSYFFAKYLKFTKVVQFFCVLVYLLNTYFILLIDGGQVGIALAYGMFPLSLIFLKKVADAFTLKNFYLSLILLSITSVADPRIAILVIGVFVFWQILEFNLKPLLFLIPLVPAWLGVNFFWFFPLIKNNLSQTMSVTTQRNVSWYNPLLLYSPHWPSNLLNFSGRPPIYFLGVPILLFFGLIIKRDRKIVQILILFLSLSFLAMGISFLDKVPFASGFRDTTKFFIPLVLFGGILIGNSIEKISKVSSTLISQIAVIVSYIFILLLVVPALLGRLNFVLSSRVANGDFNKIYLNLKNDNSFFRTAWLPERHPLTYETFNQPAIDFRDLTNFKPLSLMNASEDVYNFLNFPDYVYWLRVLGIKYVILSNNPRELVKSADEQKNWNTISALIDKTVGLTRLNWQTSIPVYKVDNSFPRFIAVKSLFAIVGSPLISGRQLPNSIYFEDGKLDPLLLLDKNPSSVLLYFNDSTKDDLAMSFLQKYFVSPAEAVKKEWAVYRPNEYLKYKYELLLRNVKFNDLDYSKGIAFSTQNGENMVYSFKVKEAGDYELIVRSMIPEKGDDNLKWNVTELTLPAGEYKRTFENVNRLQILNVVALVPKKEFNDAKKNAEVLIKRFTTINKVSNGYFTQNYLPVNITSTGTLKYEIVPTEDSHWIVFSDNYSPYWQINHNQEVSTTVPVYSSINGFYIDPSWANVKVEFRGQENLRLGLFVSLITLLILSICYLSLSS